MPEALSAVLVLAATALVVAAWWYPLPAAALFAAGMVIPGLILGHRWWDELPNAIVVDLLALSFVLGARLGLRAALVGLVLAVLAATTGDFSAGAQASTLVFSVPAWVAGRALRSRNQIAAQLDARGRELEQERETYRQERVRYERARIARDLHDIVGHNLSAIVVQAGAGRRAVADDPRIAADSLANIRTSAQLAERELEGLATLGVADHDRPTPERPTPGRPTSEDEPPTGDGQLRQLDRLVQRATATGLQIDYSIDTTIGELPAQQGQGLYYVAQEGITNALKHAPGAPIRIAIAGDDTAVSATIENGPRRREFSGLETLGGGVGLEGLRQRLHPLGGSLTAGPIDGGGWRLTARLPRSAGRSE